MSYNKSIELIENDVLIVSIMDSRGSYFMWQRGLTKEVGVYFEFNDQINGDYDIVKECKVTNDGIHVVLANGNLKHFYFPSDFNKFNELKTGLSKIYVAESHVLQFCI